MDTPVWRSVLRRWPTAVGLAAAGLQLATGASREAVAITVCVAVLCYLGAAALKRPWVAWAGVLGGSVVVVVSEISGFPFWAGIGVAALVLLVAGLIIRVPVPPLTAQTAAFVGYGAIAVAALYIDPRIGLALAGLTLAAHGVWDVIHYRRNVVVPRSLAEACVALDVPMGVGAIVLAIVN